MEPAKFTHKKVPRGPPSPPAPVLRSPPRKVTVQDQLDWKIPPCISNWKNAKGFTIPLDKRLASDGRGLVQNSISDNHAKLAEALYVADRSAREELEMRNKVQKKLKQMEKQREDERLRELASKIHEERSGISGGRGGGGGEEEEEEEDHGRGGGDRDEHAHESAEEKEARRQREALREERRRERQRDIRLEALGQKTKTARDLDRDISEKIALGMPTGKVQASSDSLFDSRLFNQSQGMDQGFGDDDEYNVYTKGLRAEKTQNIYRPKAGDAGVNADEEYEKLVKTSKFKPDTAFAGAESSSKERSGPVAFEAAKPLGADPFGLGDFMTDSDNKGRKAMDGIGKSGGGMSAAAGGSSRVGDDRGESRRREDDDGEDGRSPKRRKY